MRATREREKLVKSRETAPGAFCRQVCGKEYKQRALFAGGRKRHGPQNCSLEAVRKAEQCLGPGTLATNQQSAWDRRGDRP